MPGFQSFFRFFASFCIGQVSYQHHKGECGLAHAQTYTSLHGYRKRCITGKMSLLIAFDGHNVTAADMK